MQWWKWSIIAAGALYVADLHWRRQPPKIYVKSLRAPYNAKTIPPFGIFIDESQKDNNWLLLHELIHWRQYQQKGIFRFYADYAVQFLRYGYDAMPMEMEARIIESPEVRENYTEAVRSGRALTVYNPQFRM